MKMQNGADWGSATGLQVELRRLVEEGSSVPEAGVALRIMQRANAATERPHADLHRFVVAEQLRDSLGAAGMAAALFRDIAAQFPASRLAPKALLAAAALEPRTADSMLLLVQREYPDSPYLLAATGRDTGSYQALEDSLRMLLATAPAAPGPPPGARPARPEETGRDVRRRVPEP
jgi:hypothetical protein